MRQYYKSDKKRREETKRKKNEEKRNRRLGKNSKNTTQTGEEASKPTGVEQVPDSKIN